MMLLTKCFSSKRNVKSESIVTLIHIALAKPSWYGTRQVEVGVAVRRPVHTLNLRR